MRGIKKVTSIPLAKKIPVEIRKQGELNEKSFEDDMSGGFRYSWRRVRR
jgi:hypothetical protein